MSNVSSPPQAARPELAAFLRGRRARVRPADVGLPDGARRRTPGLRREEVAQLADVGASWYTWLEQGRDIHVSEAFLERLAQALRLTPAERAHLFELAQGRSPRRAAVAAASVSEALQRTLDAHPYPAIVSTPRWDIVACNAAADTLFGTITGTNALWSTFMDPVKRARRVHWEADARSLVARFRVDAGRASDRGEFDTLAAQLAGVSQEFQRMWEDHEVLEDVETAKVLVYPDVGVIELDHITLTHAEPDGRTLRVTFDLPRPGASAERVARLLGMSTR